MRAENDDYCLAVRERYGAISGFGRDSHQALRALFDREFPHFVKLDFQNIVEVARKSGFTGPIFNIIKDWDRVHARDEWRYLTGTPYGDGVMFFRADRDATFFRRRFGGEAGTTSPPDFPRSRFVAGVGQFPVPIGWHHLDGDRMHNEGSKAILRRVTEWCETNVSAGLWSIGIKGPILCGGYEIIGDFIEQTVQFTHAREADHFRAYLADTPLGLEALSDERVVDVGYVTWPSAYMGERDVASMFPEDRKWCSENGVGFTWQVLTTSEFVEADAGRRTYRTLFRFRDRRTAEAFSDWRRPTELPDTSVALL